MEDSFFILSDIYRLVASTWTVANEYINRECTTIEYVLEKQEANIKDLQTHLQSLQVYRRRCSMYCKLIVQAREQCQARGRHSWHKHLASDAAMENARDLQDDFASIELKMHDAEVRTEKNINFLSALVAIRENRAVTRITLVAMVFLPFSTVAAILGMQGNFAPGASQFWIFWAVVVPLTFFIIGVFAIYDHIIPILNRKRDRSLYVWLASILKRLEHNIQQRVRAKDESISLKTLWNPKSWIENLRNWLRPLDGPNVVPNPSMISLLGGVQRDIDVLKGMRKIQSQRIYANKPRVITLRL
jgi:hypothetical protein